MDLASTVLLCMLPRALGVDRIESLGREWAADDIPLLVAKHVMDELGDEYGQPLAASLGRDLRHDRRLDRRPVEGGFPRPAQECLAARASHPRGRRPVSKLVDPFFPLISSALARASST